MSTSTGAGRKWWYGSSRHFATKMPKRKGGFWPGELEELGKLRATRFSRWTRVTRVGERSKGSSGLLPTCHSANLHLSLLFVIGPTTEQIA